MLTPAASAASASAQIRSSAVSIPAAPSLAGHVVSIVSDSKTSWSDVAELLELAAAQHRVRDHELARVLGRLGEQVALGADARGDAHHDRLADRVDRRVRHLREQLLEVRVEERLAAGEDGERRVVPHRADRLLRVARERREDRLHVLLARSRTGAGACAAESRAGRAAGRSRAGRRGGASPTRPTAAYGARLATACFTSCVGDDPALGEVDEEELARLQAALADDVRRLARRGRPSRRRARPSRRRSRASGPGGGRSGRASRRSRARRRTRSPPARPTPPSGSWWNA